MFLLNPQNVRILIIHEMKNFFEVYKTQLTETLRESNLPAVGIQRTNVFINTLGDDNILFHIKNDVSMEGTFINVDKIENFAQKIYFSQQYKNADQYRQYRHVSKKYMF